MLVPLQRDQLKAIQRDIEAQFAALPLFRAGRRRIMEAYARHAATVCAVLEQNGWLDASSPDLSKASVMIERLASSFRAILRTTAATRPGIGAPQRRCTIESRIHAARLLGGHVCAARDGVGAGQRDRPLRDCGIGSCNPRAGSRRAIRG